MIAVPSIDIGRIADDTHNYFGPFDLPGPSGPGDGNFVVADQPSSAQTVPDEVVVSNDFDPTRSASSGTYVDDGSKTSAEKARDDNLGFFNQLIGSLNGYNQKVLQDLMSSATQAQYLYEERMSNTAYQRAVADMKKAGLNPAVLFSQGNANAATTPMVGISQVATENQLLQTFSSAGMLLQGLGALLNSILGNVLTKSFKNTNFNISQLLK